MNEKRVVEINVEDILPNRFQPRLKFNETAIQELSDSIKEHGVIQPIVVRKIADKYEIIAGERRYKASVMAGKLTIPAIITDLTDNESAEVALIENVQRQNLTPIEEAISYKKILDMGYLTQDVLASKLGKTQSTVANKLRLLNLEEEVQEALLNGQISERHARSLLKITGKDQVDLLNRIIKERLTVRATDLEVEKILHPRQEEKHIDTDLNNDNISTENKEIPFNFEQFINNSLKNDEDISSLNIPSNPIIEDEKDEKNNIDELKIKNDYTTSNEFDDFTPSPITPISLNEDNNIEKKDDDIIIPQPVDLPEINVDAEKNNDSNKFFNFDLIQENEDDVEDDTMESNENEENTFNDNQSPFSFTPITPISLNEENNIEKPSLEEKTIEPIIFEPLNIEEINNSKIRFDGIKYNPNSFTDSTPSSDIRTVINTVRSCADTVKKFGYKVDVKENDEDDIYKIIFEIRKN